MKHLSVERLKYLKKETSEVFAQEIQTMIEVCLFYHPDNHMEGFEPTPWPEKKGEAPAV